MTMCTTINTRVAIEASAKGANGWFAADHAYVGYDHPFHIDLEHAVSLDLVDERGGPGARLAVELSRDAARALAEQILVTLDEADRYEARDGARGEARAEQ
jgi:hypothetical protein